MSFREDSRQQTRKLADSRHCRHGSWQTADTEVGRQPTWKLADGRHGSWQTADMEVGRQQTSKLADIANIKCCKDVCVFQAFKLFYA